MSTAELRNKVISQLEFADESILKEVLSLIEFETDQGIFKLSAAQKKSVDISKKQIKEGHSFSNQEVNEEMEAWLNE